MSRQINFRRLFYITGLGTRAATTSNLHPASERVDTTSQQPHPRRRVDNRAGVRNF
jgi:hypothetical protein